MITIVTLWDESLSVGYLSSQAVDTSNTINCIIVEPLFVTGPWKHEVCTVE